MADAKKYAVGRFTPQGRDEYDDPRYAIIDPETGEILDDAGGYGYRSVQKAHAGYSYTRRSPAEKQALKDKKKAVRRWAGTHQDFCDALADWETEMCMDSGGKERLTAKDLDKIFREEGYTDLPFTAAEFLKYF